MGVRITLFAAELKSLAAHLHEYPDEVGNPCTFRNWLRAQSSSSTFDIRQISDGYRRWWFRPVLNKILDTWIFNKDEYDTASAIFDKILQGWDSGTNWENLYKSRPQLNSFLAPYSDSDLRIGFLDTNDIELLLTLFGELTRLEDYQFQRPEKTPGIVPDADEWDDWVKGRIAEILSIQELNYQQPCVVSFIG
jgi:hypothetical protein